MAPSRGSPTVGALDVAVLGGTSWLGGTVAVEPWAGEEYRTSTARDEPT